jgi:hypothetical protein
MVIRAADMDQDMRALAVTVMATEAVTTVVAAGIMVAVAAMPEGTAAVAAGIVVVVTAVADN